MLKRDAYFLTAAIVSLFLNRRNRFVYVKLFINTSENSCSSSADSFCAFLCSNSIDTSEINNVSAFSNSKEKKIKIIPLVRSRMRYHLLKFIASSGLGPTENYLFQIVTRSSFIKNYALNSSKHILFMWFIIKYILWYL